MTVVVEFNALGGGDQTRCAPGDPDSGVAALRGAGFEPTRAAQVPGYFVCRIDGKPADDPCQRASPEDAYWSYWHAEPGGSWTFSNAGAAEYDPAPGSVEGWSFGGGEPPSTPPPARGQPQQQPSTRPSPVAAQPAPAPSRSPEPTAGATSAPRPPTASAASARPSPSASPRPSATPSVPPTRRAAPTPSATPGGPALTVDDPATPEEGGSPLVGVLLALAVVAGLGAAAAFQAQRRR